MASGEVENIIEISFLSKCFFSFFLAVQVFLSFAGVCEVQLCFCVNLWNICGYFTLKLVSVLGLLSCKDL